MKDRARDRGRGANTVTYGSNARHISDMSDPDGNYFVLLGGQGRPVQLIDRARSVGVVAPGRLRSQCP